MYCLKKYCVPLLRSKLCTDRAMQQITTHLEQSLDISAIELLVHSFQRTSVVYSNKVIEQGLTRFLNHEW